MSLREIAKEELAEILRKHALWCRSAEGGECADLTYANLTSADLRSANLRSANLTSANLTYADLTYADLRSANLTSADLTYADLMYADLRSANLTSANLEPIKNDVIASILLLPNEIPFLKSAIIEGRIDGSTYEGECACLAGTMAHACHLDFAKFQMEKRMPIDANSPRERWFIGIKKGDTPETNQVSKITLDWIDQAISMIDRIRKTAPEVV